VCGLSPPRESQPDVVLTWRPRTAANPGIDHRSGCGRDNGHRHGVGSLAPLEVSSSDLGPARTSSTNCGRNRRRILCAFSTWRTPERKISGCPRKRVSPQSYSYKWNMPLLEDWPPCEAKNLQQNESPHKRANATVDQFITAHHSSVRAAACGRKDRHTVDARDRAPVGTT